RRRRSFEGAQIAWVPPANYHLTLKFLGSIKEELIDAVAGALKKIEKAPFEMRAYGLGAFPNAAHANILWAGLDGGDPLKKLQANVENAMAEIGFIKEERAFHPHVTVARVKDRGAIDFAAAWSGEVEFGASQANEFVIYESKTLRAGA